MAPLFWIPGILSLLLALNWKHGAGSPLPITPDKAPCTTYHPCATNLMIQIKSQLVQLNSSANVLLILYCRVQGEPFRHNVDKLCDNNLKNFPSFHTEGTEKKKLMELYRIISYIYTFLGNITQDQKTLNPNNQNLQNKLNYTMSTLRGLLSNAFCCLCNEYHVGKVVIFSSPHTSSKNIFQKKMLGYQLLVKYKKIIAELAQAF
ncbi:PREDICTED: leukemia inhibitory factor-like [Chrysochloris asiatica]|uniref:Leukemia inhibitory factor n=1 Tax=Chrysochloris asiatica TaxID=185453 RepID=A0A9B0WVD7_CHRAS|nr:PREDICTED: leukemia inhibitory factor-like [Chrysochloris asiatica]